MMQQVFAFLIAISTLFYFPAACLAGAEFRVAVDIGHTPETKGALSARNRPEYDFNRKMALTIIRELKKEPRVLALLVNPGGEEISLDRRAELVTAAHAHLLISVHHDSVQPGYLSQWTWKGAPAQYCDKYRGYSIFISEKNGRPKASRSFALVLGGAMRQAGFLPSAHHAEMIKGEGKTPVDAQRGVYRYDNAVILKQTRCPAVILECGIIRNRSEELLLRNPAYRLRMARAVVKAVNSGRGLVVSER